MSALWRAARTAAVTLVMAGAFLTILLSLSFSLLSVRVWCTSSLQTCQCAFLSSLYAGVYRRLVNENGCVLSSHVRVMLVLACCIGGCRATDENHFNDWDINRPRERKRTMDHGTSKQVVSTYCFERAISKWWSLCGSLRLQRLTVYRHKPDGTS